MSIVVYSFEDKDGNEQGTYRTMDPDEARRYAMKHKLMWIANTYEWSDSELVDDFTGIAEEDDETHEPIPSDYPVQPLGVGEVAASKATCGHCGLSWDDGKATGMTPAPSGRCPFEPFHVYHQRDDDDE